MLNFKRLFISRLSTYLVKKQEGFTFIGKVDSNLIEYDSVDLGNVIEFRNLSLSNEEFYLSHQDY